MSKRIWILLFLLSLPFFCFAGTEILFQQKDQTVLIDFENTSYFFPHNMETTVAQLWGSDTATASSSRDHYYGNQLIGLIEVKTDTTNTHLQDEVVITFEYVSNYAQDWCYLLEGSDSRYMRPFGVDIFARREATLGAGGHDDLRDAEGNRAYNVNLGNQSNAENPTGKIKTITIPSAIASQYDAIWFDIALVLENSVNDDGSIQGVGSTYQIVPSDSYYIACLKVSVDCGDASDVLFIYFNGYYKPSTVPSSSTGSIIPNMNITKLSSANTIDIREFLSTQNLQADIASYVFSTNTYKPGKTDDSKKTATAWVYLSASSDQNVNTDGFLLRHISSNGNISSNVTNHNSIAFLAYMSSETSNGHKNGDTTTRVVEFDGRGGYSGGSITGNYLVIENQRTTDQDGNIMYRWYDNGTIYIKIPQNQTIGDNPVTENTLAAGQYTSNIYVHVVTNF